MSTTSTDDQDGLPPPGNRWGSGAQSVLPYLTKSLQAKPATAHETREPRQQPDGNPVFTKWPPAPPG